MEQKQKDELQKLSSFQLNEITNSLYREVKDNPKDKIELELGDSKDSSKLQPQTKIEEEKGKGTILAGFIKENNNVNSALVLAIMADKTEQNVLIRKEANKSLSITLLYGLVTANEAPYNISI